MTTTHAPTARRRAPLLLAAAALLAAGAAQAQPYPNKPIRLVIGFAPGGAADFVARALSDPLGRALGQTVVVDNRVGAGSSIAADFVAKAPPDGYTVLIASPSSISVNPALNPKLSYSAKDLVPLLRISASPLVVAVHPGAGIGSIAELIATAKKKPGALNYSSSGNGSAPHLGAAHFSRVAGVEMLHIPYKGGAPAIQSVIAGETQLTFGTPPSVLPMVQAGRLRALAITSANRSPLVPDVPGMIEAGLPAYAMSFWYGLFVPVGTPPEVMRKIFDATHEAMQKPEVKAVLAREGTEVALSKSSAEFVAFLEEDNRFWAKLVKDSGVKID
ncbi:MAG: tripartite tricarboxylate transporter substrate binding protein [Rubrivivax sp.]|nr:tripartite tricarboxylate transporter substrate binding protein [Rubrivivax sp.]